MTGPQVPVEVDRYQPDTRAVHLRPGIPDTHDFRLVPVHASRPDSSRSGLAR